MAQSQTLQNSKTDLLSTKDLDFHGRQITNAADAVNDQDYVTLKQVNALIMTATEAQTIVKQSIVKKFSGLSPSLPVKTDAASNLTTGLIDLNTEITGVLPIVNGGTAGATAAAARTALSVAKLPQAISGVNFSNGGSQTVTVPGSSFTAPVGGGPCTGSFDVVINGASFTISGTQALI